MATGTMANSMQADRAESLTFERFGGLCALLAGIAGFLYSLAFVVIARSNSSLGTTLYSLFQLLGGLLVTAALVALFTRLREADASFSLWALGLGLVSAAGSAIHGAYDLANAINPPASDPVAAANLPSQIDPRGVLTFGVAGLAVFVFSWLMTRSKAFPAGLGYLGYLLGVLLVLIYLARLIILDATNPLVVVAVLPTGFLINPAWYIWLGLVLWRRGAGMMNSQPL